MAKRVPKGGLSLSVVEQNLWTPLTLEGEPKGDGLLYLSASLLPATVKEAGQGPCPSLGYSVRMNDVHATGKLSIVIERKAVDATLLCGSIVLLSLFMK